MAPRSRASNAIVPQPRLLILTEHPPPVPERPATGLALRHWNMARAWAARGAEVAWAFRSASAADPVPNPPAESPLSEVLALDGADELHAWLARNPIDALLLGYWELAADLPERIGAALALDYVAPRLLERQFEDRDRLADDVQRLLPLLARCDEVWVGNERQADLLVPLLLLAGHDCRQAAPVRVVPIAGTIVETDVDEPVGRATAGAPLRLLHGGRDWPWRQAGRWLEPLRNATGAAWHLVETAEQTGLNSLADYRAALSRADLVLELSDDNLERRYSQSFRMCDALCAGVPVLCNRFLPLAADIERAQAGWLVDAPDELPALLTAIAEDRDERARRAASAQALARARFDADRVYGELLDHVPDLARRARERSAVRPLLASTTPRAAGLRQALGDYLARWVHHRLRLPFHRFVSRRLAGRPRPKPGREAWVVVSRPDIFPTDHGAAVKIERTAWGLSFEVGEVLLLTDRRDRYWRYVRGQRSEHRFPFWLRLIGWPRLVGLLRLMARGLPYSNAFLYLPLVDRGLHARLMWLIARHPVAVVQGEFPAYAHPAVWAQRLFGTASLLVEHNVEYRRIADQVPELGEAARLYLKRIEVDLANSCDQVIAVSEPDRKQLIQAGVHGGKLAMIPHGVDLDAFRDAAPVDLRARCKIPPDHAVLVFHGIYSYPPNLDAVRELSGVLLPNLAEAGHPAHVVAIGPEAPDETLAGVTFTGPVTDLAGHLKGADLAVIPLRSGGGTRMKILDDFAAGVAVVSTAKGMEGIAVTPGRELIVADDPDAMARAVIDLLADPAHRAELAERARQWVADYDWRTIARRYVALFTRE